MTENDIASYSIPQLSVMVRTKQLKPLDVLQAYRHIIKNSGSSFFSSFFTDELLFDAVDEPVSTSAIIGIPFAVTENICVQGQSTNMGTKHWSYTPACGAEPLCKMLDYGAVPIGYLKNGEFGLKTVNDCPADVISEGLVPFALCTDYACETLITAASHGNMALRPTYGACSRYGLLSRVPSVEQYCAVARNANDLDYFSACLLINNQLDSTSYNGLLPLDAYHGNRSFNLFAYRIGVFDRSPRSSACSGALHRAAELFELLNAQVLPVNLPFYGGELDALELVSASECNIEEILGRSAAGSTLLSEEAYKGYLADLSDRCKSEILLKNLIWSRNDLKCSLDAAKTVRARTFQAFERAFERCDAIITTFTASEFEKDGLFCPDSFAAAIALSGHCALTLPCDTDKNGDTVGLMLIGRRFSDPPLLFLADSFESTRKFVRKKGKKE